MDGDRIKQLVDASVTPTQLFDCDKNLVAENAAFRERYRLATSAARQGLVDHEHAGRPSAFRAAVAGHHRALPLGEVEGAGIVAHFFPLSLAGDGAISHVQVTYVETPLPAKRAEHLPPSLYGDGESTTIERQLRFIVDHVPQLVWSTLPDGFHDFYNRRWYEYIGADAEQTQGGGWNDPLHPEDQQVAWERWNLSLTSGEPYEIEYRFRRHDGVYRWFLGRAVPMRDETGAIVRWFGTCTDIDDQKRALRELEEATRLKDEFLASASHELRTPLNAILGWARMQRIRPELAPRAMEVIERNANAQTMLVNDLLDMSRIIAGKMAVESGTVDVGAVIGSATDTVRPAALAKHIALDVDVDAEVGTLVGDVNRLRQVVWNLLSNAVKFTPQGGRAAVTARRHGNDVVIEVSDSGRGIEAAFLPYVFDRFRQAEGGVARREGGLGLGLAIAKHLVELHGGTIAVRSEGAGRGATFSVRLPLRAKAPSSSSLATTSERAAIALTGAPLDQRLDGLRILVVDDTKDGRELVGQLLGHVGAEVSLADSVEAALEACAEASPDIVLSDIGMPERSGYDLVEELRSSGYKKPIIALTAFARDEDRAHALRVGFDAFIAKPAEPAHLVKTIAAVRAERGLGVPPGI